MIADACEEVGLDVTDLSMETTQKLASGFPEEASVRNPVDMIASANAESYHFALDTVLSDPNVDAAIAAFVPPLGIKQLDVARKIRLAAEAHPMKPVLAVLMGREGLEEGRAHLQEAGVPAYLFPESATQALSGLVQYSRWLERPVEHPKKYEVDSARARDILDGAEADGRSRLLEPEALDLLDAYGIPTVAHTFVASPEEAGAAGEKIGFPVVVKAVSPDIVHKSDIGAVRIGLQTARGPSACRFGYTGERSH